MITRYSVFIFNPLDYDCTIQEVIDQANNLGMATEIIKPSFIEVIFRKGNTPIPAPKVKLHPHGLTDEDRINSLMTFFHFLGLHKNLYSKYSK